MTSASNNKPYDCCTGASRNTPVTIYNHPGQKKIDYRTGRYADFKQSLLAKLSGAQAGSLNQLDTRDDRDFTIALLDSFATMADVITFYQERIATESYLRTAQERLSVLELARLIGYELRPGVAANTYLAFTLENDSLPVTIAAGSQAQSIPEDGALPQKFETTQAVEVRPEWNLLRSRQTRPHRFTDGATDRQGNLLDTFHFIGLSTGLTKGDALLFDKGTGDTPLLRFASEVTSENALNRTRVKVVPPALPTFQVIVIALPYIILGAAGTVSEETKRYQGQTIKGADFKAKASYEGFQVRQVFANLAATTPPAPRVVAFRRRVSIFGHNAPPWAALPANLREGEVVPTSATATKFVAGPYANQNLWVDALNINTYPSNSTGNPGEKYIYLDNVYKDIATGSLIVLQNGGNWQHYTVLDASEVSLSNFTLNGKVTRLRIQLPEDDLGNFVDPTAFSVRGTTVHAQSELLDLARMPIPDPVELSEIDLDTWIEGLEKKRILLVCGELSTSLGNIACEPAIIDDVEHVVEHEGFTRLNLTQNLTNKYVRSSVSIYANVAPATHGETVMEILGSGDGAKAFQQFPLSHARLTYLSSSNHPSGAESTLKLRVDRVLWHEVDDFRDSGPNDQHYILRHNEYGHTTVVFGDGRQGARLSTGVENVQAEYRKGIGRAGNIPAGKITLLSKRPLGVRSVTNPIEASGAADGENLTEAQQNAPLTVQTFDRIVTLQDYEDFARAFAGVSKALATWTWFGQERGVFLTLAGTDGTNIKSTSKTHTDLLSQIKSLGDPSIPLQIAGDPSYRPVFFLVEGTVVINANYIVDVVLAAIERELRSRYSFAARAFGQPVHRSDVIATIQKVPGVISVDLDALYRSTQPRALETILTAAMPQTGSRTAVKPAELLILDPRPMSLGVKQHA
jgi:predicted phage baseplate assembly protein